MLSDARESMNRVKKGVFLVRKGSNMTFNIAKIGKFWEKKGKIWKIWLIRNFCRENGNFSPKKHHSEILGPPKNFFVPPNSAPVLRHWLCVMKTGENSCISGCMLSHRCRLLQFLYLIVNIVYFFYSHSIFYCSACTMCPGFSFTSVITWMHFECKLDNVPSWPPKTFLSWPPEGRIPNCRRTLKKNFNFLCVVVLPLQ